MCLVGYLPISNVLKTNFLKRLERFVRLVFPAPHKGFWQRTFHSGVRKVR
jgi:hypothetical protein